jgi:5'(3')-deoxyribonucleotidase
MARLFVDMDGTLAVFQPVDKLETLYEKGYFLNLAPHERVVDAVKNIIQTRSDIEVYVLSAVLSDSKFALDEKNAWINSFLPEIPTERRIFPPCGTDKKRYIPKGIKSDDFLLDDYTHNLTLWQPPARGIKLLNGINHTTGT